MKSVSQIFAVFQCLALWIALLGSHAQAQSISYEKQIAPLLDSYCIDCHGDTDADGEFRLDSFANLLVGGKSGKVVAAGKSADSLLVKFLEGTSDRKGKNQFMPPGKRDKMKPEEIALIKAWIDAGLKGPVLADAKPAGPREVITPKIAPKSMLPGAVQAVAFSPQAQLAAVGRYAEVALINPTTRAVIRKLAGFKGKANAVVFSPDGTWIYGAGGEAGIGGEVYRWRVADGALNQRYLGHLDACYGLAVSPDGKTLATGGYDQKIKLWDAESGKELATLKGHNGAVNGLTFRPDGKVLASASADRTVKLWALPQGLRLDTLSQPTKEQAAVVFSADGKQLLAAGGDNRIRIWSVSAAAKEGTNPILTSRFAHEGGILNLVLSADGKLFASAATDKSVKIWNAADLSEKVQIEKQPDWSPALAFNDKAQLLVGRLNGSLDAYSSADGKMAMVMAPKAKKPAKPAKPELTRLDPPAVSAGGSQMIDVVGKGLNAAGLMVKVMQPGLTAEIVAGSVKPTQATLKITAAATVPRGAYDLWLSSPEGESAKQKVYVEDLPLLVTKAASFKSGPMPVPSLPASIWGTLTETGQHDSYRFHAKAGDDLVFDFAAAQIMSKAKAPTLEILDALGAVLVVNRGLDSGSDPFISWKARAEGNYEVRISNTTMDGSADHDYRLTVGALPFATGWSPLSAQVGQDVKVALIGHHLGDEGAVMVKAGAEGSQPIPVDAKAMRTRSKPTLRVSALPHVAEAEGNDEAKSAQAVTLPATINGSLFKGAATTPDVDCFGFDAKAGQTWIIETLAAMAGSPADTKIEVLHADGQPVARLLLQSVRDSYNNFRSVDANNADIRLQNWEEMELNEFVYFSGDVMRIFRMPRGPDGGVFFYTSNGMRRSYFDTSATAHTLDEPCYVVEPKPPGTMLVANGLPVYTLNYSNDDSGDRKLGRDSRLTFIAPKDGRYVVRVTDTRGWSGPRYVYALTIRSSQPDFSIQLTGTNPTVSPGSSIGFSLRADRKDDFDGPIEVDITGVPEGYFVSSPLVIDAGHTLAAGSLHAAPGAKADADWSRLAIHAHAAVAGRQVTHDVTNFGKVTLGAAPPLVIVLEPDQNGKPVMRALGAEKAPLELVIAPGQTVKAWLRAVRTGNDGIINLDVHGLPHGVIIDDIGLNGVQIREKETERPFFFRAANWVQEQDRLVHGALSSTRSEQDSASLQTSFPILLKVRKAVTVTAK
ncbi:MAG: c-type cytochrome domain-containing protein [Prosthecobacter sp.]|nr:c-type cytochrome domain-containing protein [Prosthecobacter sp.]